MNIPRFRIRTLMMAVAVAGVGMWIARWDASIGIVYAVAVVGLAIPVTPDSNDSFRLRDGARRMWLCYLAGVLGPTICLLFDPIVFRGFEFNGGRVGYRILLRPFFYSFMVISMVLLTLWIRLGNAPNPWAGLISGALWAGALFALALGLLLLPLSIVGLLALIGALGFTPFATAYAFFVQGRDAAERSALGLERRRVVILQLIGAVLLVACSVLVQVFVRTFA